MEHDQTVTSPGAITSTKNRSRPSASSNNNNYHPAWDRHPSSVVPSNIPKMGLSHPREPQPEMILSFRIITGVG